MRKQSWTSFSPIYDRSTILTHQIMINLIHDRYGIYRTPPTISSPVMVGMYISGDSPLEHN
jgi:hypothetical protein